MINQAHIRQFYFSKKYVPSDKELLNLQDSMQKYIVIARYLAQDPNVNTPNKLKEKVCSFISFILDGFATDGFIDARLYEIQAIKKLLKNPKYISNHYKAAKENPTTRSLYTADMDAAVSIALSQAISELERIETFAADNGLTSSTNFNTLLITSDNLEEAKKHIKLTLNILQQNNSVDKIKIVLENRLSKVEDFVKQKQIASLEVIASFFNTFRLTNTYFASYQATSKKFGFADLNYELSSNSFTKDTVGLLESFSPEFLNTLSLNDLCFLNSFWCNRFAKECTDMQKAFTAINDLDLWETLMTKNEYINLPEDALIASCQKSKFIAKLLSETFNMCQRNVFNEEQKQGHSINSITHDYTRFYQELGNAISDEYQNHFSQSLNGENDFLKDVAFASPFVNLQKFIYQKKSNIVEPLIRDMLETKHLKNWGIIRKEYSKEKNGNSIDVFDTKRPFALVAFDIEGFNMPFRLHLSRETLLDLAKVSTNSSLIPEYQGFEDFIVNNQLIPSNIIMPIQKKHKDVIISNSRKEGANKNLWEHFYFLMNGKFPPHLTQEIAKSKKNVVASRIPIVYTDLLTGKRYTKQKENYVEVNDNDGR